MNPVAGLPAERPEGSASSQTRAWVAYRAKVRDVAARWCDAPHDARPDDGYSYACTYCDACAARELIAQGLA